MNQVDKYSIRSFWSDEDECFISVCSEFPSLSAVGETREEASSEMQSLLEFVLDEMNKEGKNPPESSASRELKGNIALRIDPFEHKRILNIAEESNRSMNQTLGLIITLGIERYYAQHAESEVSRKIDKLQADLRMHDHQGYSGRDYRE